MAPSFAMDDDTDQLDQPLTPEQWHQPALAGDPNFVGPVKPSDDSIASAQAAPAAPKPQIPMVTADDLQSAQDQKRQILGIGAIGNALANRQSAGNFYLHQMAPKQDTMGPAEALAGTVDQGIKNKQILQKQALEAPELQYMQSAIDPDSDISKTSVQLHQALLKKYATGLGHSNPEMAGVFSQAADSLNGKSAYDVGKTMDGPLGKIMSQEDIQATKNALMAGIAGAHLAQGQAKIDQGNQRIAMQKDNQANTAVGALDKDPLLQSTQRQINQIGVDKHTLSSVQTITPQMVHEIGAGIAAALNQGKSVGLGQMEMQDMGTLQTKIAQAEQMLMNKPENGASPEIRQQMMDTLDRLSDAYQKIQGTRAKQVQVGRTYAANPAANSAIEQKVQSYQPADSGLGGAGVPGVPNANAAGGYSDQDRAALQWAQANPKDPRATKILLKLMQQGSGK